MSQRPLLRRLLFVAAWPLCLVLVGCPRPGPSGPTSERVDEPQGPRSFSELTPVTSVATVGDVHYAGTHDGLWAYEAGKGRDPQARRVEGLPEDRIVGLAGDASGNLWVASENGISRKQKDTWDVIPFPRNLGEPSAAMLATAEGLWVGGTRGLGLLRNGQWTSFLPGGRITYLLEDVSTDGVWVGTDGEGLYHYRKGRFEPHAAAKGQVVRRVRCLTYSPEGGLFVVGQAETGERLTFFDGRFWTQYRARVAGPLGWVQMVGTQVLLSAGSRVVALKRMVTRLSRPGDDRPAEAMGPIILDATPSRDAPFGYPTPLFETEPLGHWLPPEATQVIGFARHILLGTRHLGMAMYDGKETTWYRRQDFLGDNGRLRMACSAMACYVPGKDGTAYVFRDEKFSPITISPEAGIRVQGFLEDGKGGVLAVHVPGDRQALVVSRLTGDRFVPAYETTFTYPSGTIEVRFLRLGPTGDLWAGLWYSDQTDQRQPWGVVVLKAVPDALDASPSPPPSSSSPDEPGAGAAPTTPAPGAGAAGAAPTTPAPAAEAAASTPSGPPSGTAPAADRVTAAPKKEPAVTFHRSTLLPDEERPAGSLALPDDVRDVWFEADRIWLATGLGVCLVQGQEVTLFSENEGLESELTYAVVRSATGELLVATFSGVGRLVGQKWYFDFEGPLASATHMFVKKGDSLWIGTSRGLLRQGGGKEQRIDALQGLASDSVLDLHLQEYPVEHPRLWVLTDAGLSLVDIPPL